MIGKLQNEIIWIIDLIYDVIRGIALAPFMILSHLFKRLFPYYRQENLDLVEERSATNMWSDDADK